MITVREMTVWPGNTLNHDYILTDDRRTMLGYVKVGDRLPTLFKHPHNFDARGRAFKLLLRTIDPEPDRVGRNWTVTGSTGKNYTVTEISGQYSCTCPQHQYRGAKCKHIDEIISKESV